MLNQSDYGRRGTNTSFAPTDGDRHAEYAAIRTPGTRKHHLTDTEQAVVVSRCGELADALGYRDADFEPAGRR